MPISCDECLNVIGWKRMVYTWGIVNSYLVLGITKNEYFNFPSGILVATVAGISAVT